ncbi:hypothetical protein A8C50_01685 [Ligilactobacillus salivarius]|uniref:Transmembrane protein n=1 Tax=Ligilactobacillus salivarius TaxID=1624 RepID=A0A2A2X905_9LACO|nr:hypothetical protein A8C33_01365 [Ligilactobacillus salivarius]PAY28982.1 hypothetical protein A8C49_01005 [Ligilactobacillus salivarius]PAY30543.1 hypothetical protein A8C44_00850 [Ligilactobacillus salivarius]PAY33571.1 hypothetical protein A8C50_01685 [Ligilactobacillus salivarius]PAY39652.1 hypothetical protein A8C51_01510 [Ligilactobacillus salivarius]
MVKIKTIQLDIKSSQNQMISATFLICSKFVLKNSKVIIVVKLNLVKLLRKGRIIFMEMLFSALDLYLLLFKVFIFLSPFCLLSGFWSFIRVKKELRK